MVIALADFVFLAIGNKPNSSLVPAEYLNPKTKRVKVNKSLQVLNKDSSDPLPGIYALGDVSDFEESKLYAALDGQASTVSKNLLADLTKPESAPKTIHKPIHGTIAIPLGAYGGASEIMGYTLGLGVRLKLLLSVSYLQNQVEPRSLMLYGPLISHWPPPLPRGEDCLCGCFEACIQTNQSKPPALISRHHIHGVHQPPS